MPVISDKIFSFEGFTLDLRRGCLRNQDREVELRPKSFQVLRYLLENAGRLVAKDELIRAVWPNVIVTDESLTRRVSEVRFALQDQAQRIIKTVPRRGYLLAAPVSRPALEPGGRAKPPEIAPAPLTRVEAPASTASRGTDYREPGGASLDQRSAERRQLAIMACEVVGLAALSTQLDPEDLGEVTSSCHRRCTEIIGRHHGYLAAAPAPAC